MLRACFLHANGTDFLTEAGLSCRAILDAGQERGVEVIYDNLTDFGNTRRLILQGDVIIVSTIIPCDYEFLLIDFLVGCGKPYIKWEQGYSCCVKRNALCFADARVNNCCTAERYGAYRKLFAHARLSVFTSPSQYQIHHQLYGAAIRNYLILTSPVVCSLFWEKVWEACSFPQKRLPWKNVLVYKSFGGLGDFLFAIPAIHKIAGQAEKLSLCVPFALYDLLKKEFSSYQIFPEDHVHNADPARFDKIIDLGNYPSANKDTGKQHQMWFPSYRRLKQHAVQHYLDAAATLHPNIDNQYNGYPHFKSAHPLNGRYFTVHPGAGFAAKCWPAAEFGRLIEMILGLFHDLECRLILGAGDPLIGELFQEIPARVSVANGSLEALGDVLAGSLFHIGNDSGITHLAGAFNVPVVTIHGPTGPGTWMNFSEHRELIWGKAGVCNISCNYQIAAGCSHRICLHSVTPQRVLSHVLKLLSGILPEQKDDRYLFNPQAIVHPHEDSYLIQMHEKELLVEFSENAEKEMFADLLKDKLPPSGFSESFRNLMQVLNENELVFKIPLLPGGPVKKERADGKKTDITLVGHVLKRDSIGRHGIVIAEMLQETFSINGITTREPGADDIKPALFKKLTRFDAAGKLALYTDVLWYNGLRDAYKRLPLNSEIKVCYSMFEGSAIPQEWVTIINSHFDGVIVPDKWLLDVYKNSGVKRPVKVLPLGCYLNEFLKHPLKQRHGEVFTFGLSSGIWMRKNVAGVIEAFKLAFPEMTEKVKLRIHTRFGFESEVRRIYNLIDNDPRIEFFVTTLSDKDYLGFMASLDAYVILSMGEGFSVTPREAMALGLPVILSGNTAHQTICASGLVEAVPTAREVPGFYEAFNRAHGSFFLPDIKVAARLMRALFEDRANIYERAQERRNWAAKYDIANLRTQYVDAMSIILNEGLTAFFSQKREASM